MIFGCRKVRKSHNLLIYTLFFEERGGYLIGGEFTSLSCFRPIYVPYLCGAATLGNVRAHLGSVPPLCPRGACGGGYLYFSSTSFIKAMVSISCASTFGMPLCYKWE